MDGGNGVVVMVNSDNGRILDEIINSVATVYKWKDFYTPVVRKIVAVPAALLNAYAGKYVLDKDTVTINTSGKAMLVVNNVQHYPIYFFTEYDFFSPDLPFDLKFEKEANGKITGIYFKNDGGEMRAKRIE